MPYPSSEKGNENLMFMQSKNIQNDLFLHRWLISENIFLIQTTSGLLWKEIPLAARFKYRF